MDHDSRRSASRIHRIPEYLKIHNTEYVLGAIVEGPGVGRGAEGESGTEGGSPPGERVVSQVAWHMAPEGEEEEIGIEKSVYLRQSAVILYSHFPIGIQNATNED